MNINDRSNSVDHQMAQSYTTFESDEDTRMSGIEPVVPDSHASLRNEESRDIRNQPLGEPIMLDRVGAIYDDPKKAYAAVMSDPDNIRYVPANIDQREKIVKAALQQNGYFLKYLTEEEKSNKDLVYLALQKFDDDDVGSDGLDNEDFISPLHYANPSLHTDMELFSLLLDSDSFGYTVCLFVGLQGVTLEMVIKALDCRGPVVIFSLSDNYLSGNYLRDNKVVEWLVKHYQPDKYYAHGVLSKMPDEFKNNKECMKDMLSRDGNILCEVPDQYKCDLEMIGLAAEAGANYALYTLEGNIKQDINNIIKFGIFDVEPNKITKLKGGINYDLDALTKALASSEPNALPIPIAAKLVGDVIEPLFSETVGHKREEASQRLEGVINALPLSKRLALGSLFSKNMSISSGSINAQTGVEIKVAGTELKKVAESLYRDKHSLVHVPNFELYIGHMCAWLGRFGVRAFRIQVLFSSERCAPLFESSNKNSVLYITESELEFFGSSLNGLLESSTWEVDGVVDQVKARIVVVGDQKGLSPDVRSRLCCHMDAASAKLSSVPKASVKPVQQFDQDHFKQVTIESDVERLLNLHFLSARECFNAHNKNKTLDINSSDSFEGGVRLSDG